MRCSRSPMARPSRSAMWVRLVPAGHVLGSAQIVLDYRGARVVVSGDYKRRPDPTCAPFEPCNCDLFITEATFGLPVFRHPPDRPGDRQAAALAALFPGALPPRRGLCARQMPARPGAVAARGIRGAGLSARRADRADRALREPRRAARAGAALAPGSPRDALKGRIVLAPPAATADRWSRRLPDPLVAMASGWMRVRQRAKARGVELPLVISDHADWDELTATIDEVAAEEIWVTHGREEALVHYATQEGLPRPRAGAHRLRGRRVNRFAALLDALLFTPSRNGKLRLMQEYFASAARPGAGLGIGGADRRAGLRRGQAEPGARARRRAGRPRAARLVL